jgi:hypothetical protein
MKPNPDTYSARELLGQRFVFELLAREPQDAPSPCISISMAYRCNTPRRRLQ